MKRKSREPKPDPYGEDEEWDPVPLQGTLPCPFCGGPPEGDRIDGPGPYLPFWVFCSNRDCNATTTSSNTKNGALAIWNRRSKAS